MEPRECASRPCKVLGQVRWQPCGFARLMLAQIARPLFLTTSIRTIRRFSRAGSPIPIHDSLRMPIGDAYLGIFCQRIYSFQFLEARVNRLQTNNEKKLMEKIYRKYTCTMRIPCKTTLYCI